MVPCSLPKCMLEVFAGSASLSKAVRDLPEWSSATFDMANDESQNILNDAVFLDLIQSVVDGRYGALHLGVPCTTWTRARRPALRTESFLFGVPNFPARSRRQLEEGSEIARRSLVLLNLASSQGLWVSLESPLTSLLWLHPGYRLWQSDWSISCATVHYCAWGSLFKKPTRLAASYPEIVQLNSQCPGDHVHVVLRGKAQDGR